MEGWNGFSIWLSILRIIIFVLSAKYNDKIDIVKMVLKFSYKTLSLIIRLSFFKISIGRKKYYYGKSAVIQVEQRIYILPPVLYKRRQPKGASTNL